MARIDDSVAQLLFIPTAPRQNYADDLEMPGIPTDTSGFTPAADLTDAKPPSLADKIMAQYDSQIYPRIMSIFNQQLPALSERDFNYLAIKNLAHSKVVSEKSGYALLLRKNNWKMISDLLTQYITNTVIRKYMRLKTNKMSENRLRYGAEQYSYGVSDATGVFPVDGPITEIPNRIDFSVPRPPFRQHAQPAFIKPEQSRALNGKGI